MSVQPIVERLNRNESSEPRQKPVLVKTLPFASQQGKALFADSLLEITGGQRSRRMWTTIFSAIFQCLLVGIAVFLSLWYINVLPREELVTMLTTPSPPPPAAPSPPASPALKVARAAGNMVNGALMAPSRIPSMILIPAEPEPPAPDGIGVVGGVPGGMPGGVFGGLMKSVSRPHVAMQTAPAPKRIIISQGVTEGMIVSKIDPVYPPIARAARVDGVVILKATIAKDGTIQNLQVISGPAMLAPAAVDAVKQWRYRPYLLNGEPVEVETTVQAIFQLQ